MSGYCECLDTTSYHYGGACSDCGLPTPPVKRGAWKIYRVWLHEGAINIEPGALNTTIVIARSKREAEDLYLRQRQAQWLLYCEGDDPDNEEEPYPRELDDVCYGIEYWGPVDRPRVIDYMGE